MPKKDVLLVGSSTAPKDNKANDAQDKQQDTQAKKMMTALGNSVTAQLMDQSMTDNEKQLANEVLETLNATKDSIDIEQSTDTEQQSAYEPLTVNNEQEEVTGQGMGPLASQMGEQQGMKEDTTQPSFAVQQLNNVPQVDNVSQVPQPPVATKGRGGSGIISFFKNIVSIFTGCFVVRRISRWRHGKNSAKAIGDAQRRADELAKQMNDKGDNNEQGPQLGVQPQPDQRLDFTADPSRVPAIWEKPLAYGTETPKLELHASYGKAGDRNERTGSGHSFVVLRYSKEERGSGKQRRYRLAFGFFPRFNVDERIKMSLHATIPGSLREESGNSSLTGRSYDITADKLNAVMEEAPRDADKGYNMVTHNCTTFAVNMLGAAGVSAPGLQEEHINIGMEEAALPVATISAILDLDDLRSTMLRRMGSNDYDYARQGKKLVSLEEIKQFEDSLKYEDTEAVGYGPAMLGEYLREQNHSEGGVGNIVATDTFASLKTLEHTKVRNGIIAPYEVPGKSGKIAGVQANMLTPLRHLILEVSDASAPIISDNTEQGRKEKAEIMAKRRAFIKDDAGFAERIDSIKALVQAWMGTIDRKVDINLDMLGYTMLSEISVLKDEFDRLHGEQEEDEKKSPFGIDETAATMLAPTKVFSRDLEQNPLYIKCFGKIFGGMSIAGYYLAEGALMNSKNQTDAQVRELTMMYRKKIAVTDYYKAEQLKFNQLVGTRSLTQQQTNDIFADQGKNNVNSIQAQRAYAIVLFDKMLPNAIGKLQANIDRYKVLTDKSGYKSISGDDACELSCHMIQMVDDAINNNNDGIFDSIVQAIAVGGAGGAKRSESEISQLLLSSLFNGFFDVITARTPAPTRYIQSVSDTNRLSDKAKAAGSYIKLMEDRDKLVAKIETRAKSVLSKM